MCCCDVTSPSLWTPERNVYRLEFKGGKQALVDGASFFLRPPYQPPVITSFILQVSL